MPTQSNKEPLEMLPPDYLSISISGPPAIVMRLLAGMAADPARVPVPFAEQQVEPLYLTRSQASTHSGLSRERLSSLVKLRELRNYGTRGNMRFSLSDITEWQAKDRR